MFGLLKRKNAPHEKEHKQAAHRLYRQMLQQACRPEFYKDYGVPDSFDGRFDLLLVQAFIIVHVAIGHGKAGQALSQALFDETFKDMDQTLREMGIGDVGVPKHMRRMMKAFNGRVKTYEEAFTDEAVFEAALARNLYGTLPEPDANAVRAMAHYIRCAVDVLKSKPVDALFNGDIQLDEVEIVSAPRAA